MTLKQFLKTFYPGQYYVNIYDEGQQIACGWLNDLIFLIEDHTLDCGNIKVNSYTRTQITVGNNGITLSITVNTLPVKKAYR